MSEAEELLHRQLLEAGLEPEMEYRFAALACGGAGKGLRTRLQAAGLRDWRFDFALPDLRLAVEVEGGGWSGGRHTRGVGFEADLQKYGEAQGLGWTVYRCSPAMVWSGKAIGTIITIVRLLKSKGVA